MSNGNKFYIPTWCRDSMVDSICSRLDSSSSHLQHRAQRWVSYCRPGPPRATRPVNGAFVGLTLPYRIPTGPWQSLLQIFYLLPPLFVETPLHQYQTTKRIEFNRPLRGCIEYLRFGARSREESLCCSLDSFNGSCLLLHEASAVTKQPLLTLMTETTVKSDWPQLKRWLWCKDIIYSLHHCSHLRTEVMLKEADYCWFGYFARRHKTATPMLAPGAKR